MPMIAPARILYVIFANQILRSLGMDVVAMQGKRVDRASENRRGAHYSSDRSAAEGDEAPTIHQVLFEIGLAFGGFLFIALLAQLVVVAIHA